MWYTFICTDKPDSLAKRKQARGDHLARLEALQAEGKLLTAGPNPAIDNEEPGDNGFSGSLIVAEFDSLQAAQAWADQDPYIAAGVYESVVVKPYKKVF